MKEFVKNTAVTWLTGIAMGTADIVPGISGGTMAFILGIYEKLIYSVRHLTKSSSWFFLLPLLTGMSTAFLVLAGPLHQILNHPDLREILYSVFLGLIAASILLLSREIKNWSKMAFLFFVLGALGGWSLTGSNGSQKGEFKVEYPVDLISEKNQLLNYVEGYVTELSLSEIQAMKSKGFINENTPVYKSNEPFMLLEKENFSLLDFKLVGAGMVAITAMLLPGISGSYLLNIMGLYAPAITAVADLSAGLRLGEIDMNAIRFLSSMGVGIVLGAAIFSHAIAWLLSRYHSYAIALLIGFMMGALKTVWPYWEIAWKLNPLRLDKGADLIPLNPVFPNFFSFNFFLSLVAMTMGLLFVLMIEKAAKKNN